jgi:signal-transduction protein with cAMP-binding, CBS, and nucleotidyltransferase domain
MRLNIELTQAIQRLVLAVDLYDSGELYRTIEVFTEQANAINIQVRANYYLEYHLTDTDFIQRFTDLPEFERFLSQALAKSIERSIDGFLENKQNEDFNLPKINLQFEFLD